MLIVKNLPPPPNPHSTCLLNTTVVIRILTVITKAVATIRGIFGIKLQLDYTVVIHPIRLEVTERVNMPIKYTHCNSCIVLKIIPFLSELLKNFTVSLQVVL